MCTQPYARLALDGQDRRWTCPLTLQTKTVHQRIGAGISTTLWERKPDCTGPHTPYRTPFSPQIGGGAYGGGATTVALKLLFSPLFVCLEAQPRNFPVSFLRSALVLSLSAKGHQACSSNGRPFRRPGPQVWRHTRTPGVADHMEHRTACNTQAYRHAESQAHTGGFPRGRPRRKKPVATEAELLNRVDMRNENQRSNNTEKNLIKTGA